MVFNKLKYFGYCLVLVAKTISFHSYKGGTGKTTIAANLSMSLASKGYHVLLIDMDVYAPSLHVYFSFKPSKWLNDYLLDDFDFSDVIYDFAHIMENSTLPLQMKDDGKKGTFDIVFSNPKKEEIMNLDIKTKDSSKSQMLKKMLNLRMKTSSESQYDYVILDTSPGIRYWSINALAISDIIILSLKMDNIDIEGTKQMASDVYKSFINFGAKSYLLLNRTAGYCNPPKLDKDVLQNPGRFEFTVLEQHETIEDLENYLKMDVISAIPCYCDIQFQRQEFLTVMKYPNHQFTGKIDQLAEKILSG
jgi:chromosome partitioning protein